mmetsp:Transcript_6705/g.14613  ORF Transcript_6705/g.14613 Transcript_6705/m.14613 type:complete len:300 (-) Transcript_6705:67-966(-)
MTAPLGPEGFVLIKRCIELLSNVDSFIEKSEDAIQRSRRDARIVTTLVSKSLARRTFDLSSMKKSLEQHIGDVNYAIAQAERGVEKQEKRIPPSDKVRQQKLHDTKLLLKDLLKTRRELVEDLRCKICALDLDNACRRVTPQIASEKKRVRADSRPRSAAGTQRSGLNNSASAPCLQVSVTEPPPEGLQDTSMEGESTRGADDPTSTAPSALASTSGTLTLPPASKTPKAQATATAAATPQAAPAAKTAATPSATPPAKPAANSAAEPTEAPTEAPTATPAATPAPAAAPVADPEAAAT